jgi:hypothetical protein
VGVVFEGMKSLVKVQWPTVSGVISVMLESIYADLASDGCRVSHKLEL